MVLFQKNFSGWNTDGSSTMAVSNSCLSPQEIKNIAANLGLFRVIFLFILKMVYCVYPLESPRRGNSNGNTQHTSY